MSNFHTTPAKVRTQRLNTLRQLMQAQGIDALIVPSADPHMSEYLPVHWQGRAWLSGFTGSVGTLVVLPDFAGLWVDSRYWVQAPIQLAGTDITPQKMQQHEPTFAQFLAQTLPSGAKVAIDGAVLSLAQADELNNEFAKNNIHLMTNIDLLGQLWTERPPLPTAKIVVHDPAFVDTTTNEKLAKVRQKMTEHGAQHHLISSLDDIAWLTNLRGADVSFNPVFLAHLLIGQDDAVLFVDDKKLSEPAKNQLQNANIAVLPYEQVKAALAQVADFLLIDPAKVALGTLQHLPKTTRLIKALNPTTLLKAVKSANDIAHIQEAMRQDGAALCEFFAEFEQRLADGERLSELDVDDLLNKARARQPHHVSASFDTIAGFAGNGAIVHYKATPERFSYLDGSGLLLIDSGAQYQNGTTDITRMMGIGTISDEQKRDVTYVLKAHIALARAHFPAGIFSGKIDILARNELWQQGLDYGHGTGHGVGYFLNVHEAPQVISHSVMPTPERVMLAGMISSNEPGLYREGKWGVRLENLLVSVKAASTEFGEFLKFETLTLCPFDTRLILPALLNDTEKTWLNTYHQRVHDELIGRVSGSAKAWLVARTQPI
ncbi:MAG: aminopeptidase P family protein [Moraxella sp.]|nr:aminopeptidase P family protein [Moraxella sp.]